MTVQGKMIRLARIVYPKTWDCSCGEVFLTEEGLRKHREVQHGQDIIIFRCTECGKITQHLSTLHGHAEKHTPFYSFANFDRLMEYTEMLQVTEYDDRDPVEHYNETTRGENQQ